MGILKNTNKNTEIKTSSLHSLLHFEITVLYDFYLYLYTTLAGLFQNLWERWKFCGLQSLLSIMEDVCATGLLRMEH